MQIVFNLRDPKAKDWDVFWKASADENTQIERFGFRMFVRDLATDATRIATACQEQMRWAKNILRAEEIATMKRATQTVKDCRSHRGMVGAIKSMATAERIRTDVIRYINELLN